MIIDNIIRIIKFKVIENSDSNYVLGDGIRIETDRYQYNLNIISANIEDSGMIDR